MVPKPHHPRAEKGGVKDRSPGGWRAARRRRSLYAVITRSRSSWRDIQLWRWITRTLAEAARTLQRQLRRMMAALRGTTPPSR